MDNPRSANGHKWTEEEDLILVNAKYMEDIFQALPHRTANAVTQRMYNKGLPYIPYRDDVRNAYSLRRRKCAERVVHPGPSSGNERDAKGGTARRPERRSIPGMPKFSWDKSA